MSNKTSLIQKIFSNCEKERNKIAIKFNDKEITYEELQMRINDFSNMLLKNNYNGASISILVTKGYEHVVALLSCMKTNNVFSSIDHKLPLDRIILMLEASDSKIIIVDNKSISRVKELNKMLGNQLTIINIDDKTISIGIDNKYKRMNENICYIFFTSGSTGTPKPIIGSVEGLEKFVYWEIEEFGITKSDNVGFLSAIGFDPMLRDIFVPLVSGGSLMIPTEQEILEIDEFQNWVIKNEVNILHMVPTLYKYLIDNCSNREIFYYLKFIMLAGEVLRGKDIKTFFERNLNERTKLVNLYGPTETSLAKFFYVISKDDIEKTYVPVGKPIKDVEYILLNDSGKPVEDGQEGEVYIKPNFIPLGYYKKEELNKLSFKKDKDNRVMYKTGDIGVREDENLILIGRNDNQVKVNGIRTELSEIENIALEIDGIKDTRVISINNNLVMYYCSEEDNLKEKIIENLTKKLPKQIIPLEYIRIEEIPKNHSGKIDRIKLKEMYDKKIENNIQSNNLAIEILKKSFGLENISRDDIFNSSLIDSLKYARLKNELKQIGIVIKLKELKNIKSIKELENLIAEYGKKVDNKYCKDNNKLKKCNLIQEKMYYTSRLAENSVYNVLKCYDLGSNIDIDRLEKAIDINFREIEILKYKFKETNTGIVFDEENINIKLERIPFDKNIEDSIYSWAKIFDLKIDDLCQIGILEYRKSYLLVFNIHHMICDEGSMEILIESIMKTYCKNILPKYTDYSKFVQWNNNEILDSEEETKKFMKTNLDGITNVDLPTDRVIPNIKKFRGNESLINISEIDIINKINAISLEKGITFFTIFNAAINIILAKYSQSEDIVINTPVSLRRLKKFENVFGPLINVIPIRNIIDYDKTVSNYLTELAINNIEFIDHPYISMEDIKFYDKTSDVRIAYSFHDKRDFDKVIKEYNLKEYNLKTRTSKFNIMFEFTLHKDNIILRTEYDNEIFNEDTILRMNKHIINCLIQIINNPDIKIRDIELITQEELEAYKNLDNLKAEFNRNKTVKDLFEDVVDKYPSKIALKFENNEITYEELDRKSNIIANFIKNRNIRKEKIGILCEKNIECIAIIIGIIKSGNAYVPINIDYPEERIKYIINDLKPKLVITNNSMNDDYKYIKNCTNIEYIYEQEKNSSRLNIDIKQQDPLYVIYTSGTTGKPKGAIITHRNLIRLLFNSKIQFDFNENDIWTMFHSYCFDFSVWEMYGALLYGGKLILVPELRARDPRAYLRLLKEENVSVLNQTPSYFYKLIEELEKEESNLSVRIIVFGGEALDIKKTEKFYKIYPHVKLINMYGITETTVHVTYKEIQEKDFECNCSNIGKPIPTLRVILLDKNKNLQLIGVPGEIYVIGEGVCKGYVNNEKLTSERFLYDKENNTYMYKSGDLAKILPNGELAYVGRNDEQVKIRGFRIELGEIENAIRAVEHTIRELVVTTRKDEDGNQFIIAYYTGDFTISMTEIKKKMMTLLPEYMIPAYIVKVNSIPITVNGKTDRKKLNMIPITIETGNKYIEARNDLEKNIKKIFSAVLKNNKISITDNFFSIGGDSFKALKASYMSKGLFTIQELYENPTIETLAKQVAMINKENNKKVYYYNKVKKARATVVCVPYAGGETIIHKDLAKEIIQKTNDINIGVIDTNSISKDIYKDLDEIVEDLMEQDERIPYIIYTHCAGDGVGLYIANLLKEKNRIVKRIIIGASLPPEIDKNKYFETNYWKDSSNEEIIDFLEELDDSINYKEIDNLNTFIEKFRHTVEIRRELLYNLNEKLNKDNQINSIAIFGKNDTYTSNYKQEIDNWNRFVRLNETIELDKAKHYFIKSHSREVSNIILGNLNNRGRKKIG